MEKTNTLALTSMILGICSIVLFWIPLIGSILPLLSLTFGIIGLVQISKNKNQSGKGMAIAGIIMGGLILLFGTLILVVAGLSYFGVFSF